MCEVKQASSASHGSAYAELSELVMTALRWARRRWPAGEREWGWPALPVEAPEGGLYGTAARPGGVADGPAADGPAIAATLEGTGSVSRPEAVAAGCGDGL